jgi:hypothetical protein
VNRRQLQSFKTAFWVSSVLITIFFFFFQIKRDGESVFEAFIYAPLLTMMFLMSLLLASTALLAIFQLGKLILDVLETFWNWLTR